MKPTYPNVTCREHTGPPKPGYAVCPHPARVLQEWATTEHLGVVACEACAENFDNEPSITLACADCLGDEVKPKGEA